MVDPENPIRAVAFEVFQTLLLHVAIFTLTGDRGWTGDPTYKKLVISHWLL